MVYVVCKGWVANRVKDEQAGEPVVVAILDEELMEGY